MFENDGTPFDEATRKFTEGQNQFAKMWTDFAGKMATTGVSFSPDSTPPDTAKQMRSAFFKALSGYCEDYMRSPEFLDSWKQAMDGAIQFRRQMNESLGKMHHELGGTSRQDVDSTMIALTHLERRIVDSLERATERLEEIANRVNALEKTVGAKATRPATTAKRATKTQSKTKARATTKRKAAAKKAAPKKKISAKKKTKTGRTIPRKK